MPAAPQTASNQRQRTRRDAEREREDGWLLVPVREAEDRQQALEAVQDALAVLALLELADWREVHHFLLSLERRARWLELTT